MADTTCGWQWPVATTAMPAAKSRKVLPSTSSTIALNDLLRFRAGQWRIQLRKLGKLFFGRLHNFLRHGFLRAVRRCARPHSAEENRSINAEKVRALAGRLDVALVNAPLHDCGRNVHLYFHRTEPSFVSSTRIPESESCWRISSERLKSRRRRAALRSSMRASI